LIDLDRGGHGCSFEGSGEDPVKLRFAGARDFDRADQSRAGAQWLI
jgi:hypothetical protein